MPPVSGRAEVLADALAEADALAVAGAPSVTSGRSLAWQPSGVSLGKLGSGQGAAEAPGLADALAFVSAYA